MSDMSDQVHALKASIETYYAEFGRDIARVISTELVDKGGFEVLLPKLGLNDPIEVSARYLALLEYLRTKGTGLFLSKVSGLDKDFRIAAANTMAIQSDNDRRLREMAIREAKRREQAKLQKDYRVPTTLVPGKPLPPQEPQAVQVGKTATVKVSLPEHLSGDEIRMAQTGLKSNAPSPAPPAQPAGVAWPVHFKGPLVPGPSPEPGSVNPRSPAWDPGKPYDPAGEWPAVERRSGIERRSGTDRRGSVEMIFKNKRYGKDRRVSGERRKNWPQKGFKRPDGTDAG